MKLVVYGADVEVDDRHAKTPLLWALRDGIGLHGTNSGRGCAAADTRRTSRSAAGPAPRSASTEPWRTDRGMGAQSERMRA
jgi:hypothetical protein